MDLDPNAWLMGGGKTPGISWRDKPIGTTVTGTVCRESKMQQQHDPEDGQPLFWDPAKTQPKMQLVIYIQTTERDPSIVDDDGVRALYIKGKSLTEQTREAIRRSGRPGIEIGGVITVTFIGEGEQKIKAYAKPKLFRVEYRAPVDAASQQFAAAAAPAGTPGNGGAAQVQPGTTMAAAAGPPAGLDPAAWANLDEARRAQILNAMIAPSAFAPPF